MKKFGDLTEESAAMFCAHVRARGPARLQDFARTMSASNGPVAEMDGSLDSLVPLWKWWLEFAKDEYPGVPLVVSTQHKALTPLLERGQLQEFRGPLAIEMIEQYVFEVIKRVDPGAKWDFLRVDPESRFRDVWVHHTGILFSNGFFANFHNDFSIVSGAAKYGPTSKKQEAYSRDTYLQEMVLRYLEGFAANAKPASHESILTPLVSAPTLVWEDPMKVTPLEFVSDTVEQGAPTQGRVGEDTLFIARGADFDNLASAPPIDETAAARTLNNLGFRTLDGQPITLEMLQDSTQYFELPNQAASIDSEAHGGRLRSLILTPIVVYETEWDAMIAALTALGDEVGGELRKEGNF